MFTSTFFTFTFFTFTFHCWKKGGPALQNVWDFVLFSLVLLYTIFIQCANSQYQFHYQRIKKVFGKTSTFWNGSDRSHHSIFKNSRLSWYKTSPFEYLEQMPLIVDHVVPPKVWALLSCRLCWRRLCPWWSDDDDDDLMIWWSDYLMIKEFWSVLLFSVKPTSDAFTFRHQLIMYMVSIFSFPLQ